MTGATPWTSARSSGKLGWEPRHSLADGLRQTVEWYLAHPDWIDGDSQTTGITRAGSNNNYDRREGQK